MILGTSRAVRVFAFPAPVDLRKGYDGLYGLVQTSLKRDPLSGELFLFVNQSRKLCKVLLWDGTGLCIFQKRLEQVRISDHGERRKRRKPNAENGPWRTPKTGKPNAENGDGERPRTVVRPVPDLR